MGRNFAALFTDGFTEGLPTDTVRRLSADANYLRIYRRILFVGKSVRSNPFLGSKKDKGYVRHGMSNFSVRISTVMSLLDSPVEIRENSIQFSMETKFREFSPELKIISRSSNIFEGSMLLLSLQPTHKMRLPPWSGFLQKDEGET
ncbi:hypothetical protein V8G54_011037 [Vigna mungo]|uniref:Uncharacterized protein n=1 Tax=Vigna mungo TaxID=3915 RepID=A0AAQ3S2K3_VIGMU